MIRYETSAVIRHQLRTADRFCIIIHLIIRWNDAPREATCFLPSWVFIRRCHEYASNNLRFCLRGVAAMSQANDKLCASNRWLLGLGIMKESKEAASTPSHEALTRWPAAHSPHRGRSWPVSPRQPGPWTSLLPGSPRTRRAAGGPGWSRRSWRCPRRWCAALPNPGGHERI